MIILHNVKSMIDLLHRADVIEHNLIKIRSLTCSLLLICPGVGEQRKAHYAYHASDHMNHPMKMATARL